MAEIKVVQAHRLDETAARAAAQQVADKLAGDFGLSCQWQGNVMRFARTGVEGSLTLSPQQAVLQMELGFLMGALAPTIEAKVTDKMRRVFGAA